jgi:site-specific DNA recombinase
MEVVEAHEINLEAVMDAIDMKTFGLMAAIGKIELDNFRERASMGKRGTAKQGRIPVSNVPYGYRVGDDGRPEIVESEAEVVRRIYRMYVQEGKGAPAITRQLNAEGVPVAASGRQWWDGQVHRVLSNETYRGTWWYGRARYVSTEEGMQVYEQPQDEWIGVPFPTLVDEETWEKAKALRRKRKTKSKRNTKVFYLLQHMVRCAECGMLFGCRTTRRRTVKYNGKVYKYDLDPPRRYYRCYGVQKFRLNCRNRSYIRAERLEELVWGQVKRVVQDRDLLIAGIDALDTSEDGEMAKQVARTERDLQNIQLEEDRAIRLYVSGKITESQLDHQRKFITERLENLRAKLDDYRARESAEVERRVLMEYVLEWAEKVGEGLDDLPSEERRDVLQILLDRVMIDRDNNVVITLGIPTDDLVAIGNPEPGYRLSNRQKTLRYSWAVDLDATSGDSHKRDSGN